MGDLPIRSLTVSDFRRLEGTRELPFDAPIVLIHGSNGTGKTSVLSALELALTGGVRSMERQSEHYRAHLPFLGQAHATVRAEVAGHLRNAASGAPLSVSGARLEGAPALNAEAANFFSERCYLDQSSLGRLLDLYQAREGNEQTALETFVNELLGLEKLDALRDGLSSASDFRMFKKLAVGVDEADRDAKAAATGLREETARRSHILREVGEARSALIQAVSEGLGELGEWAGDMDLLNRVESDLHSDHIDSELPAAMELRNGLISLGGRVSGFSERSASGGRDDAKVALSDALAEKDVWSTTVGVQLSEWEASVKLVGLRTGDDPRLDVQPAVRLLERELASAGKVRDELSRLTNLLVLDRRKLADAQSRLQDAHEHSSSLVEGLTAIATAVADDLCPVCDRNFGEVSSQSLSQHIEHKLTDLTSHRDELLLIRGDRSQLIASVARLEDECSRVAERLLSEGDLESLKDRHRVLASLAAEGERMAEIKAEGRRLDKEIMHIEARVRDLEFVFSEEQYIRDELARFGDLLGGRSIEKLQDINIEWARLEGLSQKRMKDLEDGIRWRGVIRESAEKFASVLVRDRAQVEALGVMAIEKIRLDGLVAEAKRRQGVARDVLSAAGIARSSIVNRVFTDSLNEVWKSVFTRLAPHEGFIPRFGIPSVTKKTFEITLETTHREGGPGGPPQMMLSAGNLNTAALSLFIALHLAVEPIVPCLVFDDPVQAMDEVHVAQFAALIRLLAKQNGRQIVIAIHERELFDYLSLELSPAYEGDRLITIELGDRALEADGGVACHSWKPDSAIAI